MTAGDFVPENPLEEVLGAAVTDAAQRDRFLTMLYEAELLLPAPGPAPAQDRLVGAAPGSEIDLPVVDDGGRSVVPAFTSMSQLLRYVPEGGGYLQLAVRDLVRMWRDDLWLGINPRGPGVLLGPDDVRRLAPPADPGEYLLGEPRTEPEALLQAVSAYAERSGAVVAAYRGLMVDGPTQRIVIGLELDEGADRDAVFSQVTEVGRETGVDGFALVPIKRDAPGPVARYLLDHTGPFYRRGA